MPILRRSPYFQEALQDTDCNWIHINVASVLCSVIAEAMASAKIELVSIDNKYNYTLWITNCFLELPLHYRRLVEVPKNSSYNLGYKQKKNGQTLRIRTNVSCIPNASPSHWDTVSTVTYNTRGPEIWYHLEFGQIQISQINLYENYV